MFYLGDDYSGIYFTKRESDCALLLLEGRTIIDTAKNLGLSPRTVEYYVKNMKMKVGARNKSELIKKIRKTDFLKNYYFQRLHVSNREHPTD